VQQLLACVIGSPCSFMQTNVLDSEADNSTRP
jgi:hypothetical protein